MNTLDELYIKLKYERVASSDNKSLHLFLPGTIYTVDDNEEYHSYNGKPTAIETRKIAIWTYWFDHGILQRRTSQNINSGRITYDYNIKDNKHRRDRI